MKTVTGNWAASVGELRRIMIDSIKISDNTLRKDFSFYMQQTDDFHPFDGEGERMLSRALSKMLKRCNYRSCEGLAYWKDKREDFEDAIYSWGVEVEDIMREHYSDAWNFPPGTTLPDMKKVVVFPAWEKVAEKSFARLHRAALRPQKYFD